MEDYNQYLIKVRLKNLKSYYVKYIDWEYGTIQYTRYEAEAGAFEPYERALEIRDFLEAEPGVISAKIVIV